MYRFAFRPSMFGVKCVVEHEGRWLLVRNTYGRGYWTLPGGGIRRHESPADAAVREVGEEVGVRLAHVEAIGSYFSRRNYSRDTVYCFRARVGSADHEIDRREIAEATWMLPGEIPESRGAAVDEVLRLLEVVS